MTAPPSDPGDPIEAGYFNASNRAEYIALVRNQGLEVDDDMELAPDNVHLVHTPDADTLFDGQTWGWDGIDCRAVVAHNQNETSVKNSWIPKKHFLHQHIPTLYISQMVENQRPGL